MIAWELFDQSALNGWRMVTPPPDAWIAVVLVDAEGASSIAAMRDHPTEPVRGYFAPREAPARPIAVTITARRWGQVLRDYRWDGIAVDAEGRPIFHEVTE